MKVLMLNGSPRANGNVAIALKEMAEVFAKNGIETEIIQVGNQDIRGCMACGGCNKTGKCTIGMRQCMYRSSDLLSVLQGSR